MESLYTSAHSEKESGLERKHCKGKIVPNNSASSNLNLVSSILSLPFFSFSLVSCLLHPYA